MFLFDDGTGHYSTRQRCSEVVKVVALSVYKFQESEQVNWQICGQRRGLGLTQARVRAQGTWLETQFLLKVLQQYTMFNPGCRGLKDRRCSSVSFTILLYLCGYYTYFRAVLCNLFSSLAHLRPSRSPWYTTSKNIQNT